MRTHIAATAAAVLTCSLALSGQQQPAAGPRLRLRRSPAEDADSRGRRWSRPR